MRNFTAVLLVSTLIGAGGAAALAQTAPASPAAPAATTGAAAPAPAGSAPMAEDKSAAQQAGARMAQADRAALFEAHLAALHAGLTLTPDQDKLWPPVDKAIRGFVAMRAAMQDKRMGAGPDHAEDATMRGGHADEDPVAALKTYSSGLLDRAEALEALADAVDPLYATLNDDQKHRIPMLLHAIAPMHGPVAAMVARLGDEEDRGRDGHDGDWRMDRRGERGWGGRADRDWGGRGWASWHRGEHERRFGREEERDGGMADEDRIHPGPPMHRDERGAGPEDEMD